jgi:hypothetical protein
MHVDAAAITEAREILARPDVAAVAVWTDGLAHYTWPQATVDNRPSRVLARIARFGIPCDPATLVIVR